MKGRFYSGKFFMSQQLCSQFPRLSLAVLTKSDQQPMIDFNVPQHNNEKGSLENTLNERKGDSGVIHIRKSFLTAFC